MPILFVYLVQRLLLKANTLEPKEPQYKIARVLIKSLEPKKSKYKIALVLCQ